MFRWLIAHRIAAARRMMLIAEAHEYANAHGIEVAGRDVHDYAGIRRCDEVLALRRLGLHARVIIGRA